MADLTQKQVLEIQERAAKATPGPWEGAKEPHEQWWGKFPKNAPECLILCASKSVDREYRPICCTNDDGIATTDDCTNAEFISHSRADVPAMASLIEKAMGLLNAAGGGVKILAQIGGEWTHPDGSSAKVRVPPELQAEIESLLRAYYGNEGAANEGGSNG